MRPQLPQAGAVRTFKRQRSRRLTFAPTGILAHGTKHALDVTVQRPRRFARTSSGHRAQQRAIGLPLRLAIRGSVVLRLWKLSDAGAGVLQGDELPPARRQYRIVERSFPTATPSNQLAIEGQQPTNTSVSVAGAVHSLQLPASQKDHAWSQTALTGDPVPDLRWVHGIKRPGCFRVRTGTSVGSQIPRCVKTEVGVWSYADFVARDRGEDNCTGRGAKAIDDYCLA